ncbi:MAG TPA: response regulator, partial [Thermoanaerobaculaceae bacterium]|nr:response regulator [Thermoanaerobaculaceae bacterium]
MQHSLPPTSTPRISRTREEGRPPFAPPAVVGVMPSGEDERSTRLRGVHRRRALLYAIASALIALGMAGRLVAPRPIPALGVTLIGLLTAVLLVFVAARRPALASRPDLNASWLLLDALLVTWVVYLTGGTGSPWFVWYIANAGTASVVLGKRAAVFVASLDSALYLGLALATGEPAPAVLEAFLRTAATWVASYYFVRGVADLQVRRNELERMRQAQDRSLEELTRMTASLDQRTRELADAKLRIQEADRLKSQFVSNMSHELRTPLNSIIGFSEILLDRLDQDLKPKYQRFLQNIHEAGHQLLGLINDILDLSKIDAGHPELMAEPLVVQTLIEGVCTVLKSTAKKRHVTFETRAPANLPLLVADPVKVKQIVYNLVSNAVKFSHEGGIVEVEARHLSADESPLGCDSVLVAVVDHGLGIDPQHHRVIFQDFVQVDGTASRPFGGAGLGLALARRFVELHRGTIGLVSSPGKGATFTVTLPSQPPAGTAAPLAIQTLSLPEETGRRILIVADDPTSFEAIAGRLMAASYLPVRASSCQEAVQLARSLHPAAITLDLMRPGPDGWEVLRSLKSDPATRSIPVVIISVLENRELGLTLGADDYLLKPLDGDHLVHRLAELLPHPVGEPPRVLVIDDDPLLHSLLDAKLGSLGYDLDHALTGQAGIAQARVRAPHVIILDLMMEGLDGFEVAGILRNDPRTGHVPIIVFTAKDMNLQDRERLRGKIEACVEKGRTSNSGIVPVIEDVLRR